MDASPGTTVRTNHPAIPFAGDEPLVAVERGGYVGSLHRGTVAVADPSGSNLLSVGDATTSVFLRSAAKPFQAVPAILSGAIDRYSITEQELAVLCASHSGEQRHIDAVFSVLEKIGVAESALQCGTHPPMDEETATRRIQQGLPPSPVCNNCSGAHAGILAACRANGWPIHSYADVDHPVQRQIREVLSSFAGIEPERVEYAGDNCAIPTWRLPMNRAAQAFARLATAEQVPPHLREAARLIVRAMTSYPEMVGGSERFDSDLMRAGRRTLVAKGGAEGFQGIGLISEKRGIAIKVTDGNSRAIPPTAIRVLDYLGAIDRQQSVELERYREPELRNLQGTLVGKITSIFTVGGAA